MLEKIIKTLPVKKGITCVPPPLAVMTSESLTLSRMVLLNAMEKNKRHIGRNRPHRPSSSAKNARNLDGILVIAAPIVGGGVLCCG